MKDYLVTYQVLAGGDIAPLDQKMTHITADPRGDLLGQICAELKRTLMVRFHVVCYEEEIDDDYLMCNLDYCF